MWKLVSKQTVCVRFDQKSKLLHRLAHVKKLIFLRALLSVTSNLKKVAHTYKPILIYFNIEIIILIPNLLIQTQKYLSFFLFIFILLTLILPSFASSWHLLLFFIIIRVERISWRHRLVEGAAVTFSSILLCVISWLNEFTKVNQSKVLHLPHFILFYKYLQRKT